MTDSFWSSNSLVPTWTSMASHAWSGYPPKLLDTMKPPKQSRLPPGCILKKLELSDVPAVVEFWSRYFSINSACRCVVPAAHVSKMISEKRWEGILIIHVRGDILGSLGRRLIPKLHTREATWLKSGAIDFFCVHPGWRKRGIGRTLLNSLHTSVAAPISPHIIYLDTPQLRVPPVSCGVLLNRRCLSSAAQPAAQLRDPALCLAAWRKCVKGVDVWSEEPGEEISFWLDGKVVIWNTFHRAFPDGGLIGIVLSKDIAATESLAQMKSPWGVLLAPATNPLTHSYGPEWRLNSVFQWIGYNLSVGFVSGEFPVVGF